MRIASLREKLVEAPSAQWLTPRGINQRQKMGFPCLKRQNWYQISVLSDAFLIDLAQTWGPVWGCMHASSETDCSYIQQQLRFPEHVVQSLKPFMLD